MPVTTSVMTTSVMNASVTVATWITSATVAFVMTASAQAKKGIEDGRACCILGIQSKEKWGGQIPGWNISKFESLSRVNLFGAAVLDVQVAQATWKTCSQIPAQSLTEPSFHPLTSTTLPVFISNDHTEPD
jgi:hypothetical protein